MKYTQEQRLDIGKQIYDGRLSKYDASIEYGISISTAREYMRLYRDSNHLPPKNELPRMDKKTPATDFSKYNSMTKKQLIQELIRLQKSGQN